MDFIKNFDIAQYKFILELKELVSLPFYKGATLRGGFGITFKKICCVVNLASECNRCAYKSRCVYAYIFETAPLPESNKLKKLKEIPRPFIIEPPLNNKSRYNNGEIFEFNLLLIGKAISYLPYFILTFKELGDIGLGKKMAKFKLRKVCDFKGEVIFDSQDNIIKMNTTKIDIFAFINKFELKDEQITLDFLTPTRIKIKNDLIVKPEFFMVIKSLMHRLSALSYFHCNTELAVDYNLLISVAKNIKIKNENLRWVEWERYSTRQDVRMKLGGFTGRVTYEGTFKLFLPFLILGQFTHIGKNCTFGLGKYVISI
ncbi:MAG: CRISPR system precrRNA processing endoribonuclease RAMP protein Cas6 [Candidatus Omnitrophica bacterium]|nr:CRISPR system precrRNA processing endoribonuclease RAMP protein Cas6 [Candidatus Omnitrophota bacterium]